MRRALLLASALASIASASWAATGVTIQGPDGKQANVGSDGGMQVDGTFTASLGGFHQTSVGTPITATTGGVTGTLPAGAEVVLSNDDLTNTAYCALGASASINSQPIRPNSWFGFGITTDTQYSCITGAGTALVKSVGGTGLPTGAGGGTASGGGGSGETPYSPVATNTYLSSVVICSTACKSGTYQLNPDATLAGQAYNVLFLNLTTDPGSGAVLPKHCFKGGASGAGSTWNTGGEQWTIGLVIAVSTDPSCFVLTEPGPHAFISAGEK